MAIAREASTSRTENTKQRRDTSTCGALTRTARGRRFRAVAALLVLLASSGCDIFGLGTQKFMIRVDSISAPSTIGPNETLTIRFWGWVGPSGCYHLVRAPSGRMPNLFEIRFHGEYKNALCTQDPIPLEYDVELSPPFQDPFTIRALQPPDPPLEKIVRIE